MLELREDDNVYCITMSLAEVLKAIQFYNKEKERHRVKAARAYEKYKKDKAYVKEAMEKLANGHSNEN
jgi:hypothetical protein